MVKRILFLVASFSIAVLTVGASAVAGPASSVPSGQRVLGRSVVEPIYDADHAGIVRFISTPVGARINANARTAAPLYLPVYPAGATVGALICPHVPVDTCPDHGPGIAGLAASIVPSVYADGVLGHDHLAVLHGADGFSVDLEPVVVLFTTREAANEHLLTRAAVEAAIARGEALAVPLPSATLHGEQVSDAVWNLARPVD